MDVSEVRPVIRNLRARVIDGKRQLVFWDKPTGGLLVGYSIRVRVNGEQRDWCAEANRDVHWGETHHAVEVQVDGADPADVVVSVKAKNVHRHSSPVPETHLAADYRVEVGDRRHDEPRKNLDPNRPQLFLRPHDNGATDDLKHDDLQSSENLFDWAVGLGEYRLSNRTLEEIAFLCHGRKVSNTPRVSRIVTDADGVTGDVTVTSSPVNARLDRFEYEPDLHILTAVKWSSRSLKLPPLEHTPGDSPAWAADLQNALDRHGVGVEGRLVQPFGDDTPGCWGLATRVVAMHATGDAAWLRDRKDYASQAYSECWDGRVIAGHVYENIQAFCWRDFYNGVLVGLKLSDGTMPPVASFTSPSMI